MHAVALLHNNFAAHVPTVQDDLQRRLYRHFHGTETTIGAMLQLGLPSPSLVGNICECGNAAQQPEAGPTDRERAAFVAGSQAWLDNADEQARANCEEIAQASANELEEARALSEHCSRFIHSAVDSDRQMQDDADHRLAAILEELEERREQVYAATSE